MGVAFFRGIGDDKTRDSGELPDRKEGETYEEKTVHIISHSHWDREWYLPLERHKMKLLDLIDTNMELFDKDPGFTASIWMVRPSCWTTIWKSVRRSGKSC